MNRYYAPLIATPATVAALSQPHAWYTIPAMLATIGLLGAGARLGWFHRN